MRVRVAGALALMFLAASCGDGTPIGGGFIAGRRASFSPDDHGAKGMLHRRVRGKRVQIGTDVYEYRFYPPDCVLWMTGRTLFGACGDRRPFSVAISGDLDWKFEDSGANYLGSSGLYGRKRPERAQFIHIDSVRVVASRQPPLDWSYKAVRDGNGDGNAFGEFDPSLAPVVAPAFTAAEVETLDQYLETPLFEAVRKEKYKVADLLESGANPNAKNRIGMTPLMYATMYVYGADATVVRRLIAAGADVNAKDNDGKTALAHAVVEGTIPVVETLLAARADVFAHTNDGKSISDLAKERGVAPIIALIAAAERR